MKWMLNAAMVIAAVASLLMATTPAQAVVVFSDDFEFPDVGPGPFGLFNGQPRTSNMRDTTKWVGATQGFGASENGLLDESSGDFTDPDGSQAYGFRYTNSGVTTAEGVIGSLEAGAYTASFEVVRDGVPGFSDAPATSFLLELVAFDPGANRTEARGARPGTVLASAQGNAPADFSWESILLPYTATPGDPNIGKDLGLRFIGAANAAIIDDVSLDAPNGSTPPPTPTTVSLLSTDFTGRTVSGATASNITWQTNGVQDPGALTAAPVGGGTFSGLFDTANAQGHFAPDRNTGNEGAWTVDIPIALEVAQVELQEIELDWQHFNNSGNFQGVNRSVDWTATVIGSLSGVIGMETILGISGTSGIDSILFDSPLTLTNDQLWLLQIQATGSNTTGNNTGLDAINVIGTVGGAGVPEPATATLALLGVGGLLMRRRRAAA